MCLLCKMHWLKVKVQVSARASMSDGGLLKLNMICLRLDYVHGRSYLLTRYPRTLQKRASPDKLDVNRNEVYTSCDAVMWLVYLEFTGGMVGVW